VLLEPGEDPRHTARVVCAAFSQWAVKGSNLRPWD
jgi:hypothetical protein